MTASRFLPLALGLALAASVAAYASDGASKPTHYRHRRFPYGALDPSARAFVPAAPPFPVLEIFSPSYVPAPNSTKQTD